MPEFIDLLSSSPPKPKAVTISTRLRSSDIFDLGSDEFDIVGDAEFTVEQPAKKRRLSPPLVGLQRSTVSRSHTDTVFDLSSEPDILHVLPKVSERNGSPKIAVDRDDENLFTFSSSAPELIRKPTTKTSFVLDLSSDDDPMAKDPIQSSSQPQASVRPVFSSTTANLLASVRTGPEGHSTQGEPSKPPKRAQRAASADENRSERFKKAAKVVIKDAIESSQPTPISGKITKSSKSAGVEKSIKDSEKATSKAVKDAEKELEKERKKREKEEKQQQKQRAAEVAEANKSKTNKKNSTPEMILDMPNSLKGKSLANQVEEHMKELEVRLTYVDDEQVDLTNDVEAVQGSVIRWRRKVTAEFDEDQEIWKPLPRPRIRAEDHTIVYLKAEDFIRLAVVGKSTDVNDVAAISDSTMKTNLDMHISSLRQRFPKCRPIYLIEGLTSWHKRSLTAKNRAYTAAVRSQPAPILPEPSSSPPPPPSTTTTTTTTLITTISTNTTTKKRTKRTTPSLDLSSVTEETIELLLLHLQLTHQPLLIHHTTSPTTSAAQISAFTQHLSTRPYRLAQQTTNLASASFCMTTGQIRTGSTPKETWVQMLQEINRVTPSMAYGIVGAGFTNPTDLVKGFRKDGREMLQEVRKSVNTDGAWSDRRLGPMVSKRVYKVFMGKDPTARDGIA